MAQRQKMVTNGGHQENEGKNSSEAVAVIIANTEEMVGPAGLEPATR